METRELKIQVPEGFEIDKEKSTFEKIIFIEKPKPRSWEEYLTRHKHKSESPFLNLPSGDLSEAFIAMMKLTSVRQDWVGDWKPDWNKGNYCIAASNISISVGNFVNFTRPLSFPTHEMAIDFMDCFKDLLEIAKPLI